MKVWILILSLLLLVFTACEQDEIDPVNDDHKLYFPLNPGSSWIDSITTIQIDAPSEIYDTLHIVQKTIVDSMLDIADTEKFYCKRFILTNDSWDLSHRFWFERDKKNLLRFEDNETWLDLVFPLYESLTWNPYVYTIYSDTTLRNEVVRVDEPLTKNGSFYNEVLVVNHQMDSTLIYKYTDQSIYAKGKGLISREKVSIISDDPNYDYTLPIEERIKTATFISIKRYYEEDE